MSLIEKQLMDAIRLTKAETPEERQAVYEKAMKAARQMPAASSEKMINGVTLAVKNIETRILTENAAQFDTTEQNEGMPDSGLDPEKNDDFVVPPPVVSDIDDGIGHQTPKNRGVKGFDLSRMKSYTVIGIGVGLALAVFILLAYVFVGGSSETPNSSQNAKAVNETANALEPIVSNIFPEDYAKWVEQHPKNSDEPSESGFPESTSQINFDVNFLSRAFYPIDKDSDYLLQVKFNLPEGVSGKALLPILNAGVMAFGKDKKAMPGNARFLLAAHKGRLKTNLLVIEDRQVSLSGVLYGSANSADEGFVEESAFFRTFVGVKMANSTVPIELVSYEISVIN